MSSTQFQSLLPPHPVCFTSFDELLCSINKYRQDTFPSTIDIALDMSRSTPPTIPDHTSPIPIPIPTQDGRPRSNSVPRNSHSQGRIEEEMDLPEGLRSPRTSTIPLAASVHAHDHHGDRLHEVQDEEASPVIDAVMPERLPQVCLPFLSLSQHLGRDRRYLVIAFLSFPIPFLSFSTPFFSSPCLYSSMPFFPFPPFFPSLRLSCFWCKGKAANSNLRPIDQTFMDALNPNRPSRRSNQSSSKTASKPFEKNQSMKPTLSTPHGLLQVRQRDTLLTLITKSSTLIVH
ncbi:hypothetical protein BCR39DRAFT_157560 [Naematelia encephala]|uniref:Uncharacterized protein n=1 Tax=Naematelia encephala TaxID=71784 RepID=A0A1Y2B573_9TREE|nr:hypothetical protein BCR39DRAFT_157560 [Naematelia encephala]